MKRGSGDVVMRNELRGLEVEGIDVIGDAKSWGSVLVW